MADWLGHVPTRHEPDLRSRLQSKDDAQFESAFWELYLHEAYRRSGDKVVIHPPLAGTGCRPDFLVEGHGTRFYLEAVRACAPADEVRQNKAARGRAPVARDPGRLLCGVERRHERPAEPGHRGARRGGARRDRGGELSRVAAAPERAEYADAWQAVSCIYTELTGLVLPAQAPAARAAQAACRAGLPGRGRQIVEIDER